MSYSIYFKAEGKKYKLPVNPESIEVSRNLNVSTFTVLGGNEVVMPLGMALAKIKFSFELPSHTYSYMNSGIRHKADYYEKMLKKAQRDKKPIFFIASNEITDDISLRVLVTGLTIKEEAGEEGDKKVDIELLEYKGATRLYKVIETKKEEPEKAEKVETSNSITGISGNGTPVTTKSSGKSKKSRSSKKKEVRYKGSEINNVNAIISRHVMEANEKASKNIFKKPITKMNAVEKATIERLMNPKSKKRISKRGIGLWFSK